MLRKTEEGPVVSVNQHGGLGDLKPVHKLNWKGPHPIP
jgi:hypothetical protein